MIIKSREIEIPEDNPFANDVLERKESADILTEFVTSSKDPMVICIDAPWGMGKTTFLKMWKQHLKNEGIPTLYFNAWESDFSDDALLCLVGEISASIEKISKKGNESKIEKSFDQVKNASKKLLKKGIPTAIKIATASLLDINDFSKEALANLAESIVEEQIEQYEKSKQGLLEFRKTLSNFAESISGKENQKPLIFIIDELDRCRPNFAIEILEKAKHFFNVQNIIFVLGADRKQLGSSIKAIYGNELNVNGYLRRFIDFDYVLSPPKKEQFVEALFEKFNFYNYFSEKKGRITQYEESQALEMFSELFEIFRLSLREQEQCCALLNLSIRTTPINKPLYPLFLCYLIVLKINSPDIYKSILSKDITTNQIWNYLKDQTKSFDLIDSNYGIALEAFIMSSVLSYIPDDLIHKYEFTVRTSQSTDYEKDRAQKILSRFKDFQRDGGAGVLGYLIKKIEIASRFKSN